MADETYLRGDPNTDGSVRLYDTGVALSAQKRINGLWSPYNETGAVALITDWIAPDDETRLARALASGETVIGIPAGLNVSLTAAQTISAGVTLRGMGPGATVTQTGANANCFVAGGDNVTIEDITFVCPGSSGSYSAYNGAAVYATGRTGITIRRCSISGHRGWGIILVNCASIDIERIIATSANNPGTPDQTQMFADIGLIGSVSKASIARCRLTSGQAFPILVQTVANTAVTVEHVEVVDNLVAGALGHGIALYSQNQLTTAGSQLQGTGQDTWRGNIVARNRVYNTLGSLVYSTGSNKPYGTGIYIQGAHDTLVQGNTVDTACVSTDAETLAPGCIGVTNVRACSVVGNLCKNSTWYGFYYSNANIVGVDGEVLVSSANRSYGHTKAGYKWISCSDVQADGDIASKNTTYGWELRDSNAGGEYHLKNCIGIKNTLDGCATIGSAIPKVYIDNCTFSRNAQHGLGVQNSTVSRLYASNNRCLSNTSRGFSIGTGITVDVWENNFALSNGTDYVLSTTTRSVTKTSNYTVTQSEAFKNKVFNNTGASATVLFNLPASVEGMELIFYVDAAQIIRVDPNGTETVGTGGAGKYLEIPGTAKNLARIRCLVAGHWSVLSSVGTLAYEP